MVGGEEKRRGRGEGKNKREGRRGGEGVGRGGRYMVEGGKKRRCKVGRCNTYLLSPLVPGNCILDRALKQFVKSHPKEGEAIRLCHHTTYTCEYIPIQTYKYAQP